MLDNLNILIVEDESAIARCLAYGVVSAGGTVIGPIPTVAQALAVIQTTHVDAAILDGQLADRDVTPVALQLVSRNVPAIVFSGTGLPGALKAAHPDMPLVRKPAAVTVVIDTLATLIAAGQRAHALTAADSTAA